MKPSDGTLDCPCFLSSSIFFLDSFSQGVFLAGK